MRGGTVLAVDPGMAACGWVVVGSDFRILATGNDRPDAFLAMLREAAAHIMPMRFPTEEQPYLGAVLIERFASYGMRVGTDVFRSCELSGQIRERVTDRVPVVAMLPRPDVKLSLCRSRSAKDGDIRQRCIDFYRGLHGFPTSRDVTRRKACPGRARKGHGTECVACEGSGYSYRGPLSGISSHAWQALGLALAWHLSG